MAIYFLTAEPWKADDQIKAIEAKLRRLMVRATYNRKDKKSLLKLAATPRRTRGGHQPIINRGPITFDKLRRIYKDDEMSAAHQLTL
jgi:hypothetical protein